jgi:glutamyl-tRNA synthetase
VEALGWLGLDWDEGPPAAGYRQTERLAIYRDHAARLVREGRAYYCDCSPELLEREREEAQRRAETFRYPGRCRDRGLTAGALRLRIPPEGTTVVDDLIHGAVAFEHGQLDDWILVRTDGTPTYNYCVVVDDVTMRISHVIRGNDHLSNTPKQILCYEALGYTVPAFAHVPMILGADRSRLSKRHGATSVQAFRDLGVLPEAMVNYLARLGWSHGDQEIFSRDELVRLFDIKDVGASGAVFDLAKLEWLSQHAVKSMRDEELAERVRPFLPPRHRGEPAERLARIAGTLKERAKTLGELADKARFYFEDVAWDDPAAFDAKAAARFLTAEGAARLDRLHRRLAVLEDFGAASIEPAVRELAAEMGLKLVDLAQVARVAVTGGTASPPIFDVLAILGRDRTLRRLRQAEGVARARSDPA